jgi:hypothetical protein
MSKKRSKQRKQSQRRASPNRPTGGVHFVTPEGDALVLTQARYQHAAPEEIRLRPAEHPGNRVEVKIGARLLASGKEITPALLGAIIGVICL